MGFGIGDQLGNAFDRKRGIHDRYEGRARAAGNRLDVVDEIVRKIKLERRVDIIARNDVEQRVPVRRRVHDESVAMVLLAPGRFSITNDWRSRSESHCPSRRALMSPDW